MPDITVTLKGSGTLPDGTPVTLTAPVTLHLGTVPVPLPPPPSVINVPAGADLQAAINTAPAGSTLSLAAGATFAGPIVLPAKPGGGVTIQSSHADLLPPAGQRISPGYSVHMPKIVSPGSGYSAILTAPGAHDYHLIGLEVTKQTGAAVVYDLIALGDGSSAQNSLAQIPANITIDRCYIHGLPNAELKRAIALNCANASITNCCITECKGMGYDSQAICGWNGPGPFLIQNNQLEAAGENIMFGGSDPAIPNLVPSDITIRGNTLTKPLAWRSAGWTVKNLLELKIAQRVLIEGNRLVNNWVGAQSGYGVLLRSWNDGGRATWATVQDVTFKNNSVESSGCGLAIAPGTDSGPVVPTKNIRILNNLFTDIDGSHWGGDGNWLQIAGTPGVVIDHNTALQTGMAVAALPPPCPGLIYTNNASMMGSYGLKGDSAAPGADTIATYFPGGMVQANILIGGDPSLPMFYPPGFAFAPDPRNVFANPSAGDYHLHGIWTGTDGKPIGCDIDKMLAALGQ